MDAFAEMKEMGHERVLLCSNPEVGLQAIIAIHSTVLGPGLGGTRMARSPTSPFSGVPEKVCVAGSKLSQAGRAEPSSWVAE